MQSQNFAFHCEGISFLLPDIPLIQKWLLMVIDQEGKSISSLNYIFCSDDYLLKINQDHLNHDTYTDVITFQYDNDNIEGDIFISVDRTKENAKIFDVNPLLELHRVMVHGLLHLLGFKDKLPEEKDLMTQKENFYLNLLEQICSSD